MNFAVNIEQWALIDGYDNYEISSFGRVRNNKTSRIMQLYNTNDGYVYAVLCKEGKRKFFRVHRLIGFAFLEKKDEDVEVDHIDHNRANNMITNLRWATKSINQKNQSISTKNTSGTQGVFFEKCRNRWVATWFEEKKLQRKFFSIKKYGEEQSKQMAIDYRKQMAEVNGYLNV